MNKNVLFSVMLLCLLGLVAQAEEATIEPVADTYTRSGDNAGTAANLDVRGFGGGDFITYIRFDLSALNIASISSATLTLHETGGSRDDSITNGRHELYGLTNAAGNTPQNWNEGTDLDPGAEYDNTGGNDVDLGQVFNLDPDKGANVTETVPGSDDVPVTTTGPDLVTFLEQRAADNGLVTFIVAIDSDDRGYGFASRENADGGLHPTLTLTYIGGGASNPLPEDGDTVSTDLLTELSWTLADNIATCRIYFGTEPNVLTMDSLYYNPAVTSVNIDDFPSYTTPLPEDTYHWQVDGWDQFYTDPNSSDPNYFKGTLWSFNATASPVFVEITPAYQAKFVGETADPITATFNSSTGITYAWYSSEDDATDTLADDALVDTGSDTLSLGSVGIDDGAYYYCVADNGGQTVSPTVRVSIKRQLLHYTFDGNVQDSSGYNLHGIHVGEPNFVTDAIFGQSLWFDGTTDYVQCPNDLELTTPAFNDFSPGMTITVWAKPDAAAGWARFFDVGNGPGVNNIFLTREWTTGNLIYNNNNGLVNAGGEIALNVWQMFAATVDESGNVVLYKNGLPVQNGSVGAPAIVERTSNYVGESNYEADALYSGLMDDLQVWNYALTEDNIADMYAAGAGNFCRYPEIPGEYDYNGNCVVDLPDFAEFASMWLECGLYPNCN